MKPMEIIIETSLANIASWNGMTIPVHVTTSATTIHVRFESPPSADSSMEHLRREFGKIESHFSGQSLGIMRCLLASPAGQASRKELMDDIWEKVPMFGAIRQSVRRLNAVLIELNFGYIVRGSRKGIYRFVPIEM